MYIYIYIYTRTHTSQTLKLMPATTIDCGWSDLELSLYW